MKLLKTVNLKGLGKKYSGKVRDYYIVGDKRILITTDRVSAFDRVLDVIPYKGQVLNKISEFWFDKTKDIVQNHILSVPHANVTIAKSAKPIPIEMVVRGYLTGVTGTSIWGSYEKGERVIYGIKFQDGMKKNQKLSTPIITPTTKAEVGHDERLTGKEILKLKIVEPKIWRQLEKAALAVFERGTKICAKAGIILVDTKYEFGLDDKGKLMLIDEVHTPDSSRFWVKATYKERFKKGLEPENFDKEFMRIWFKKKGYAGDGKPPVMPKSFINKISKRYITIYERITGRRFVYDKSEIKDKVKEALDKKGK
jgi:phosphoribosylaminoimidazole-succinocarboxamide synthase